MHKDFAKVLLPAERIAARVAEMGHDLTTHYRRLEADHVRIVGVMSGALVFLADLIRAMPISLRISLITASSYAGKTTHSRGPQLLQQLEPDVTGEHVLLVDDILDTGQTLSLVQGLLRTRELASLRTAVLLRKPGKAPPEVLADDIGFDIPDEFVVGYGLDYDGVYRNVPDIGVLRPERYR